MKQPNILFILIDDLGWKDLSCYGSTFYETPVLDRLARDGMRFTDAYATCPVCSPSRASIMTGKYPANVGITDWIDWGGHLHPCRGRVVDVPYLKELPSREHTLAQALRDGGYSTWHVGKWHLGGPNHRPEDHGFDVNIGGCEAGAPGTYFSPWPISVLHGEDLPRGTYITDYLTDRTVELIRRHDAGRPFYLNLCHYAVHQKIEAKPDDIRKYEAKVKATGLDKVKAFEEGDFFPCEHKKTQRIIRRIVQSDPVYAGMIENLDWNIGRVLQAIEETGRAGNTIVVFTSDNGGLSTAESSPTCNAPLSEGKGWMYEGGTRVCQIVKWLGVVAPRSICSTPTTGTDFYPTFLEAVGLDPIPSQHTDGISIIPLLKGSTKFDRGPIFWHYPHYGNQGGTPAAAVRMGDHKLIEFFEDEHLELYDLMNDESERINLAGRDKSRAKRMHDLLKEWQRKVEAKIPQRNADFKPWQESKPRVQS